MIRARKFRRTIGLMLGVLLGVVVGHATGLGWSGRAAADEPAPQRDASGEYRKVLAALKAALPADDKLLERLVALHTEQVLAASGQAEHFAQRIAELEKEKQEITAKFEAATKDTEVKVKKLEEKIPVIDLLAYDKPKGKIVAVDKEQQVVQLNLGSADFVRMGLTLSVFGEGEYKPTAERKAALVVVEVTGAHACRARVTELKNAARRPLAAGDQLYNPAWTPGLRERVVVAGQIDLAGDGRDQTAAFVRALEKEGVIVDAWLDMRDGSIKGARKGIVRQTSYLIIGEVPEWDEIMAAKRTRAELEKALEITREICILRDDAARLGVTVVTARRFIALMGMNVPKADGAAPKDK